MALINQSKPTTSFANSTRIGSGETWASIPTTWASETRTWLQMVSLLTGVSKPNTGVSGNSFTTFPTTGSRNDYTGSVGFKFTVTEPVSVSQLGRLYVAGNTQNHKINLWISTDTVTPIASATVLAATTSDSNGYKYADISTPTTLTTGNTYYIAANETASGDTWKDTWVVTGSMNSIFSSIDASFTGAHDTFPGTSNNPSQMYDTVDIKYGISANFTNVAKPA